MSDNADESEKNQPANWILQHPAYQEMKSLEVGDSAQVHAAFLVYMDLHEVLNSKVSKKSKSQKVAPVRDDDSSSLEEVVAEILRRWKAVSCVKSPELQAVLLEGREREGAPVQTVLPLPVHQSLSHRSIRSALDRGFPLLLCAVGSDSTLVYQRMTDGLVTPDPPAGPFQDVGRRQHRKRRQQH